jgi:acetyl esterase
MPLHPQARAVLDQFAGAPPLDLATIPATAVRAWFDQMSQPRTLEPVHEVRDVVAPGPAGDVPLRLYRPASEEPLPAVLYFHGGGFVIGSLDTHDGTCRALANASGCAVVSVGYRLAPEHRFPAAPEDCWAALAWVAKEGAALGVDGARLAVAGDSAGGNLAATAALLARARGGPVLRHQVLIYPVTDYAFDTPSYRENGEGYFLSEAMMRWFWQQYLEDGSQGADPLASPLRAPDLAGLPPALVVTAEYDPLRDEGEAYAARLRAAGVPTELRRFPGQIHGFFSMFDAIDDGRTAIASAGRALRTALHAP